MIYRRVTVESGQRGTADYALKFVLRHFDVSFRNSFATQFTAFTNIEDQILDCWKIIRFCRGIVVV
jgi:hypothetical protein